MVHILITGGAGFIGSHLVEYHMRKGDKVHVVDDLSTGSFDNIEPFKDKPDFQFDEADILTWNGLEKAVTWADRIYHMAAVVGVFRVIADPINTLAVNIAGCERLLRAVRANSWRQQLIVASTSEVYGCGNKPTVLPGAAEPGSLEEPHEGGLTAQACQFHEDLKLTVESTKVLRWGYAVSKLADEAFCIAYAHKSDIHVMIVRFFNTIGPRQTGRYGMVVPRFVEQAVNGETITVFGDGTQQRCFCDVRDTVAGLDLLANNPASKGQIVNVGHQRPISVRKLAELIRERAGSKSPIEHIPYKEAYGEEFEEVYRRTPSLEKFYSLTKYVHAWRLEDTVDDLIESARKLLFQGV